MKISITRTNKQTNDPASRAMAGDGRRALAGATSSKEKHRTRVLGADADDHGPATALQVGLATVDDDESAAAAGGIRGWTRRARAAAGQAKEPQAHSSWTGGPSATTRVLTGLVLAGIACGPIGVGLGLANAQPQTVRSGPVTSPMAGLSASAEVGSFASSFLVAWVRADQQHASTLTAFGPVSVSALPLKGGSVSMVSVAGLVQTAVGSLPTPSVSSSASSTVSASSSGAASRTAGGSGPGGRVVSGQAQVWTVRLAATVAPAGGVPVARFYEVSVLRDAGGAMSVLAAPAVVAGPARAASVSLMYGQQVRADSQLAGTAGAFLNALVAGQGDVTRYTTPGSVIGAVTPRAYAAVSVVQVASVEMLSDRAQDTPRDGGTAHVLVTGAASTANPAETASTVQYALTMTARQGRWEVTSIDPVAVAPVASAGEGVTTTSNATSVAVPNNLPGSTPSAGVGRQ